MTDALRDLWDATNTPPRLMPAWDAEGEETLVDAGKLVPIGEAAATRALDHPRLREMLVFAGRENQ